MTRIFPKHLMRRKSLWLFPAIAAVTVVFLLTVVIKSSGEALSPDEILAKENWSDQELQSSIARSISPTMTGEKRNAVMNHLNRQLKKLPADRQEQIRLAAVVDAVNISLQQIRKMPAADRAEIINSMQKSAERNYRQLQRSSHARRQMAKRMNSKDAEVFTKEVNRVIFSEFTPEERIQFAPVTKIWIKTLNEMGH